MAAKYVVTLRGRLYGPFSSREQADIWAAEYARESAKILREITSWEIASLRAPDGPF